MKEKVHGWSGDISKLFDIDSKTYEEINTGVTYPDKDLLLNYIVAIGSVVSLPFTVLPASALIVGNWLNFGHLNNICNHCVSYKNAMETSWCKILDTKNKNKGIDVGILLHWVIDSLTPVHDISLIAKHPIDTTTIHNNYEKCFIIKWLIYKMNYQR